MAIKLKPPPLPRRSRRLRSSPRSTQETEPEQILAEEPSLEALAEPYLTVGPASPAWPATAGAQGATLEVDPQQVVSERHVTAADEATAVNAAGETPGQHVIYKRVPREDPQDGLSLDEKMLLSVIDGRRNVQVIGSISGIAPGEVQRVLESLERRALVARRS